ncbi:hypothetical protein [Priestia taiwanensis]|uniref:Uncharacterized protein n=1 Tax=Priestia taiwanensis TaxID=1347902 RepID=A0A917AN17_9BACI|nr:hypothetical protein [Priestia taiwanensis]MBM7362415.1 putative membrane protein [Priestia taiwanensis]GGE62052.1 hypothetical protein GCM10007140_10390 [Priestia taiwanensis]
MRISELKAEASRIKSPRNTTFLGYSLLVIALTSLIPFIVEEVFFSNDSWVSEVDLFTFIYIFIFGSPIFLGENKLYLQLVKGESYSANIIFTHFTSIHSYLKAIGLYFLSAVYTMLWSLLLIVPGIIKGLTYRWISAYRKYINLLFLRHG